MNMTTPDVPICPARPAGWCVAGPGRLSRSSRARPIATTTRPDHRDGVLGLRVVRSSPSLA